MRFSRISEGRTVRAGAGEGAFVGVVNWVMPCDLDKMCASSTPGCKYSQGYFPNYAEGKPSRTTALMCITTVKHYEVRQLVGTPRYDAAHPARRLTKSRCFAVRRLQQVTAKGPAPPYGSQRVDGLICVHPRLSAFDTRK